MTTPSIIQEVLRDQIIISDLNVRKFYNNDTLEELSKSFSEIGTLHPVIVRPNGDDKYELIAGSRRLKAAERLGLSHVPACVISNIDDKGALEIALSENLQRDDLNPFEEAEAIMRLMKEFGMGVREIAKRIGKKSGFVRNRIKLLSLPEELQSMVSESKLSLQHVESLANIISPEEQKKFAQLAINNALSQQELTALIEEELGKKARERNDLSRVTGKKLCLKIKNFTKFLKGITSHVLVMGEAEKLNVSVSLGELNQEISATQDRIEKECSHLGETEKQSIIVSLDTLCQEVNNTLERIKNE